MRVYSILFTMLLIVACAPVHVNYDYEKNTDFNNYKTYNYYSNLQTGLSELDTKRLLDILDQKMKTKGFVLSDQPDFLINIKSSEYEEVQQNNVGIGVGGGGGNVGGGISIGIPVGQADVNQQIIFDFIDDSNKSLFWQAVSESNFKQNLSPQEREARLQAIVEKVLSKYPPKG